MEVASAALTDVGRQRDHNEDFMLADPSLGLYVVCDGMGGAEAGEVASRMAVEAIARVIGERRNSFEDPSGAPSPQGMVAALREAIETACAEVFDEATRDAAKTGMGTTCTAVLVSGGKAVLGHVGDSRLYLCRGGAVTQLSEDHTFVAEAVKQGIFTPEEAAECAHRNIITRAIGKDRTVLVDTLVFDMALGDTLLLCSDGLHQYTRDPAELAAILSAPDPAPISARLIALANERGGSDNVTAVVLRARQTSATAAEACRSGDVLRNFETLRRIDLLCDLTMAEIVRFSQIMEEHRFRTGETIIREGEVNDVLFVIVQGSAEVVRGEHRIAILPAGAHFGEMALLNSRPRSATVRAVEPCRMLAIDRSRLYAFLQQDGMLAAKFFWKLAATLSQRLDDILAQQAVEQQQVEQQQAEQQQAEQQPVRAGYVSGYYAQPR